MKKWICALLCAVLAFSLVSCANDTAETQTDGGNVSADADFSLSAMDFVKNITAGWNLGNTFEATPEVWGSFPENYTIEDVETAWNNPKTTETMIAEVAEKGFNAVRIPVTWSNFMTVENGVVSIDDQLINRIKEVVSYCYQHDMYVIVNMHHDDKIWLSIAGTEEEFQTVVDQYRQAWTIIGEAFKDYNEKLILEGANEIIYQTNDSDADWWGNEGLYDFNPFDRLNTLFATFVETVRATGGNNAERYLMFPTYGAQWYTHQIDNLEIPGDGYHLICDIHWYSTDETAEGYAAYFSDMDTHMQFYEIPVILGECGARRDQTDEEKTAWADEYVKTAGSYGIKCFLWDDGGDFMVLDRQSLSWTSEAYVDAVITAAKEGAQLYEEKLQSQTEE